MKKVLCIVFSFALGLIVGLLSHHIYDEESNKEIDNGCQEYEKGGVFSPFGYID